MQLHYLLSSIFYIASLVVGNPCQLQIKLHGGIVLDRNQFSAQNALFAVLWLKTTEKK